MASSEKDKGERWLVFGPLLHAHQLKFIDIHTRLPNLLVGETFSNRFKIYAVDYVLMCKYPSTNCRGPAQGFIKYDDTMIQLIRIG